MDILIVDDDEKVLDAIGTCLRARDHHIRKATRGQDALRVLEDDAPQLVICDVQMPGMDGLQFLRRVRARNPDTTVVMMTADRDMDRAVSAFRMGAFDYLKKPIRIPELLDCITRVQEGLAQNSGGLQKNETR